MIGDELEPELDEVVAAIGRIGAGHFILVAEPDDPPSRAAAPAPAGD